LGETEQTTSQVLPFASLPIPLLLHSESELDCSCPSHFGWNSVNL